MRMEDSTISGSATDNLVEIWDGSSAEIRDSTLTAGSAGSAIQASGSSRLEFRNSSISGSATDSLVETLDGSSAEIRDSTISGSATEGALIKVAEGSSGQIRDATLTLDSGQNAVSVADSSDLTIRSSTISGTATDALVDVRRVSNLIIRNESTLSQTGSETPDVSVSNLSLLSVWSDSSINSVDCYAKGTVSADEGTVTDLATSCTE
jgi:pectate lyase